MTAKLLPIILAVGAMTAVAVPQLMASSSSAVQLELAEGARTLIGRASPSTASRAPLLWQSAKPLLAATAPMELGPIRVETPFGWLMQARITPDDGLQVSQVWLNGKMAESMELPFVKVQLKSGDVEVCELAHPTPLSSRCHSRLVRPGITMNRDDSLGVLSISATYELTGLALGPGAVLRITQEFLFFKETTDCAPSFDFPPIEFNCAAFRPLVTYRYTPSIVQPRSLRLLNIGQRFYFDVAGVDAAVAHQDSEPIAWIRALPPNPPVPLIPVLKPVEFEDPLPVETSVRVADFGKAGDMDNYHQADPYGNLTPPPSFVIPGCTTNTLFDCVHIHWRWPKWVDRYNFPPRWGNGRVRVPKTQVIDVFVVRDNLEADLDPPGFNVRNLLDGERIDLGGTVMWQVATDMTSPSGAGIFGLNDWFFR